MDESSETLGNFLLIVAAAAAFVVYELTRARGATTRRPAASSPSQQHAERATDAESSTHAGPTSSNDVSSAEGASGSIGNSPDLVESAPEEEGSFVPPAAAIAAVPAVSAAPVEVTAGATPSAEHDDQTDLGAGESATVPPSASPKRRAGPAHVAVGGARDEALPLRICWATRGGASKARAEQLRREAFAMNVSGFLFDTTAVSLNEYDVDNLEQEPVVLFVVSTWTGGVPPEEGKVFFQWLKDMVDDFRVSRTWLSSVKFAVFGLGHAEYDDNFCQAARDLDSWLAQLGAQRIAPLGLGDESQDLDAQFREWRDRMWPVACEIFARTKGVTAELAAKAAAEAAEAAGAGCETCGADEACTTSDKVFKTAASWEDSEATSRERVPLKEHRRRKAAARKAKAAAKARAEAAAANPTSDGGAAGGVGIDGVDGDADFLPENEEDKLNAALCAEDLESESDDSSVEEAGAGGAGGPTPASEEMVDLEDLGAVMNAAEETKKAEAEAVSAGSRAEMVTPAQRKKLTKEGYRLIGSHSGVKLCRWTKNQLRGRGGCYKHTCYGITSYQCMEATPSLACANKCVFCWRHNSHPVGREWRWQTDEPERIVEEAITKHRSMIKELKGVPGVQMDRWNAAFDVQHCALSLVGEPIMYPHINQVLRLLHERRISTFLVTNAQFPERIRELDPVTQLYVSVDAATKDRLKAIDRPLFKDFWERFLTSLDNLRDKGVRTVYRLTLVQGWNMSEVDEYAALLERGQPDFIEIKAVTYSGTSATSTLTMKNVPWHDDVREFAETIAKRAGGAYGLACEHRHSCLVLLAKRDPFLVDDTWHTWIDYPKFHELSARYYASGGSETFTSRDYMAPTPHWAVYNAPEEGFSPMEVRYRRSKSGKTEERKYKPSDSGCG